MSDFFEWVDELGRAILIVALGSALGLAMLILF